MKKILILLLTCIPLWINAQVKLNPFTGELDFNGNVTNAYVTAGVAYFVVGSDTIASDTLIGTVAMNADIATNTAAIAAQLDSIAAHWAEIAALKSTDSSYVAITFTPVASIASPVEGMVYYDSDVDSLYLYDGAGWQALNGGGGGSGTGDVLWADTTASANPGLYTQRQVDSIAAGLAGGHDAVTLAGTPNYITLNQQVLTLGLIDLTTDVTGLLPIANMNTTELDARYENELDNSAGLRAALSDETGTGAAVFATSPTFTTSITLGSTTIDETELSSIDGASGEAFDIDTTGWLLSDTILLGMSSAIDTFNTTWYYDLFDSDRTSDSAFVSHATYRCTGTTVDFNVSIFADDTINSSFPSDTIIYNFNVTNESGVSVDITTLNDQIIEKGKCVYWKIESITTAPDQFGIRLYGGRQNSTY